ARVVDLETELAPLALGDDATDDADLASPCELDRVRREIDEHLTEPGRVGLDRLGNRTVEDDLEFDPFRLRLWQEERPHIVAGPAPGHAGPPDEAPSGPDLRKVEQRVGERAEVAGGSPDDVDELRGLARRDAGAEKIRITQDRCERWADLVADARQEIEISML